MVMEVGSATLALAWLIAAWLTVAAPGQAKEKPAGAG